MIEIADDFLMFGAPIVRTRIERASTNRVLAAAGIGILVALAITWWVSTSVQYDSGTLAAYEIFKLRTDDPSTLVRSSFGGAYRKDERHFPVSISQSPPAVFPSHHCGQCLEERVRVLIQKLDLESRSDQRVDDFRHAVLPLVDGRGDRPLAGVRGAFTLISQAFWIVKIGGGSA